MTEVERKTIKSALLKCAKEQEGKPVYTGEVVPSLICKAAAERIEELEIQAEKMKEIMQTNDSCENLYHYLSCALDLYQADDFDCKACRYAECKKRLKHCELE